MGFGSALAGLSSARSDMIKNVIQLICIMATLTVLHHERTWQLRLTMLLLIIVGALAVRVVLQSLGAGDAAGDAAGGAAGGAAKFGGTI